MGNLRHDKEVRQIGGLMLILGLAVMTFPIQDLTGRISLDIMDNALYRDEDTDAIINWILLAGDLCAVLLGLVGMVIGYWALTDGGMICLTLFGIIWEQTAFIDWIAKMYNLQNGTMICQL